jgi:hypothetical protein
VLLGWAVLTLVRLVRSPATSTGGRATLDTAPQFRE